MEVTLECQYGAFGGEGVELARHPLIPWTHVAGGSVHGPHVEALPSPGELPEPRQHVPITGVIDDGMDLDCGNGLVAPHGRVEHRLLAALDFQGDGEAPAALRALGDEVGEEACRLRAVMVLAKDDDGVTVKKGADGRERILAADGWRGHCGSPDQQTHPTPSHAYLVPDSSS
jgi:hypothetical protein